MRIFLSLIGLLLFFELQGQEPYYWQLTDEDGLPSMTVYNIQQDNNGYMWIGTAAGICRYDGKEFEYYRHSEQVDDEIIYLEIDLFNRVWYSNLGGQTFYIEKGEIKKVPDLLDIEKYKFKRFKTLDSLIVLGFHDKKSTNQVSKLITIQINDTLNFNDQNLINIPGGFGDFTKDGNKLIYSSFKNKLAGFHSIDLNQNNRKTNLLNKGTQSILNNDRDFEILQTNGSELTLYSSNRIFYIDSKNDNVTYFDFPKGMNSAEILENEIWATGKEGGVFIFDKNKETLKKILFKDKTINKFFRDREENIWFSSQNSGIFIIPDFDKNLITADNSIINSHVTQTMSKGFGGQTIAGTKKGEIIFFNKGKVESSKILSGSTAIYSIEPNKKKNTLLVGTNETIFEVIRDKNLVIPLNLNAKSLSIKEIRFDSQDRLWLGNYESCRVSKSSALKNQSYKKSSKVIVKNRTYAIYPNMNGLVWIGTTQGLYQYTDTTLTPFLIDGIHEKYYFTSITQSPLDSSIWAGTHGNGLLQIKNNKVVNHFKEDNQLVSNICNDLFADDYGKLWIATSKGLQKFDLESNTFELINKYDGLPSNEILNVSVNDSIVYIGTNKGIVTFSMDVKTQNKVAPPIYFTNFSIFDKDTTLQDLYELNHEQHSLQIDFLGLAYKCRGEVKYKFRMLGIDTNWTTTNTRFARFPGLRKGDYEFQVVALNEDNVESKEPAIMKICIAPPYWETWWFRGGAFLLGVSLIGGFFNFRYKTIRRREKVEYEFNIQLNDLRAQALQTQMNPHFIFNSMNAIQHFLTMQDKENAMIYLSRFAKLIRFIFEQSKQKTISLQKELEFLELYISLEKLRFQEKVSAKIDIDSSITGLENDIHLPPLLIQPVIENAFKHGLFHKNGEGNLHIKFSYQEPILSCTVEDDGIGREKSALLNQWRKNTHTSSGIKATKERIELLNNPRQKSDSEIQENSFEIIDLSDKGQAIGTKVEIKLKNQFIYD